MHALLFQHDANNFNLLRFTGQTLESLPFPISPTRGDVLTLEGRQWQYITTVLDTFHAWELVQAKAPSQGAATDDGTPTTKPSKSTGTSSAASKMPVCMQHELWQGPVLLVPMTSTVDVPRFYDLLQKQDPIKPNLFKGLWDSAPNPEEQVSPHAIHHGLLNDIARNAISYRKALKKEEAARKKTLKGHVPSKRGRPKGTKNKSKKGKRGQRGDDGFEFAHDPASMQDTDGFDEDMDHLNEDDEDAMGGAETHDPMFHDPETMDLKEDEEDSENSEDEEHQRHLGPHANQDDNEAMDSDDDDFVETRLPEFQGSGALGEDDDEDDGDASMQDLEDDNQSAFSHSDTDDTDTESIASTTSTASSSSSTASSGTSKSTRNTLRKRQIQQIRKRREDASSSSHAI